MNALWITKGSYIDASGPGETRFIDSKGKGVNYLAASLPAPVARDGACLALTRRRSTDARGGSLASFHRELRVGTIAKRASIPREQALCGWSCGCIAAVTPGIHTPCGDDLRPSRPDFDAGGATEADSQA